MSPLVIKSNDSSSAIKGFQCKLRWSKLRQSPSKIASAVFTGYSDDLHHAYEELPFDWSTKKEPSFNK